MTEPGYIAPPPPGWWVRKDRIGTAEVEYAWDTHAVGLKPSIDYRPALRIANPNVGPQAMRNKFRRKPRAQTRQFAVGFDAVGATSAPGLAGSGSETHVLGASASALLAFFHIEVASASRPTITVTAGGVSMTEIGTVGSYYNTGGYYHYLVAYGLLAPPTGSQSIAWTSSVSGYATLNSLSYTNVSSFGTAVTDSSNANGNATVTVPSGNAAMVAAAFASYGTTTFSGFNKTQRYNVSYSAGVRLATVAGDADGASSVTVSATGTTTWAGIGIPLQP